MLAKAGPRSHQPAAAQIFLGVLRLHQGDALAAGGRAQQQQVLVKARPAAAVAAGLDAVGLQPQRPVGTLGILQ